MSVIRFKFTMSPENITYWFEIVCWLWYMVLNSTFKNISAISWRSVFISGGNQRTRRKQSTCHKTLTNFITYYWIEYTSPWTGFELTTLVVICTDSIGSNCKSKYNTITATTSLNLNCWWHWNEMCCNNIYHSCQ